MGTLSRDNSANSVATAGASMNASQLWQTALIGLKKRLTVTAYDHYVSLTTIIDFDGERIVLEAPNPFSMNTLQTRFANDIEAELSRVLGHRVKVEFTIAGNNQVVQRPTPPRPRPVPEKPQAVNQQRELTASVGNLLSNLTFDTYVVGSSNRMAHAAANAVAEQPGKQFNPFFVHGGVGLGKTHLLHAIGNRAVELNPNLRVLYVSSEMFTNDVINAIRHQRMEDFRDRYRTIDILMVDDIQFIAGKESTQEEFFHTFNALHQSGKQVIVSSDKPPRAIAALEERMRSRFAGGLVTDVQSPDFEMRTAILRQKAEERHARVNDDVLEYIARRDQTNIRELEGALTKLLMAAQLYNRPITLNLAIEALSDGAVRASRQTTAGDVIEAVCEQFSIEEKELLGRSRTRHVSFPRHICMYIMRKDADMSYEEIARVLRRSDHTTALHGCDQDREGDGARRQPA
ncbi:MAG: chromosomal replication initiator protein DnaA [Thermomicrobiales bacterium]|nr:chromosomal replication initiator protein DnaA [Thermomicrobiales bacterium]